MRHGVFFFEVGVTVEYDAPASAGAALADNARNRIVTDVQADGDLNDAPGVLSTAAHHKLPMLTVMRNNRAAEHHGPALSKDVRKAPYKMLIPDIRSIHTTSQRAITATTTYLIH